MKHQLLSNYLAGRTVGVGGMARLVLAIFRMWLSEVGKHHTANALREYTQGRVCSPEGIAYDQRRIALNHRWVW